MVKNIMMKDAIFLSASIPDRRRNERYFKTADIVAINSAVSALVHVTIGRRPLIWGGHPAITPMVWTVAKDLNVDYGNWVHLYQSLFFEDRYPDENAEFQNVTYTKLINGDREKSLLEMRKTMLTDNQFSAGVFIGGMEGIIDEYELFVELQPQASIVPVFSTGGAVLDIANDLAENTDLTEDYDYVSLLHRYLNISPKEIRYNKLVEQPNDLNKRIWSPDSHE